MIDTLVPLYRDKRRAVVLAGYQHNFQLSETEGVLRIVTGAGGKRA